MNTVGLFFLVHIHGDDVMQGHVCNSFHPIAKKSFGDIDSTNIVFSNQTKCISQITTAGNFHVDLSDHLIQHIEKTKPKRIALI